MTDTLSIVFLVFTFLMTDLESIRSNECDLEIFVNMF